MTPKDAPFTGYTYTDSDLKPTPEFSEAFSLISSSKGWKRWPKIISKKVYERIHDEAWQCITTFAVPTPQWRFKDFMRDLIDYYLAHGTLKPDNQYYFWELGLFAIFKRRIDEAIRRRVRAIRAAAVRRLKLQSIQAAETPAAETPAAETPAAETPAVSDTIPQEEKPERDAGLLQDAVPDLEATNREATHPVYSKMPLSTFIDIKAQQSGNPIEDH